MGGNYSICISGVRSCYDEGKRVAETLMFDYHRQHGIGNSFSFVFWLIHDNKLFLYPNFVFCTKQQKSVLLEFSTLTDLG